MGGFSSVLSGGFVKRVKVVSDGFYDRFGVYFGVRFGVSCGLIAALVIVWLPFVLCNTWCRSLWPRGSDGDEGELVLLSAGFIPSFVMLVCR